VDRGRDLEALRDPDSLRERIVVTRLDNMLDEHVELGPQLSSPRRLLSAVWMVCDCGAQLVRPAIAEEQQR
jgi:hypothetical protein